MRHDVLSVIVPVKDEAATLDELLQFVEEAPLPGMTKEIIVVDDGSTDATPQILDGYRGRPGYVVLRHEVNQGKGAAIRSALDVATGSIAVIQDADHEYDPSDFSALVAPIREGRARVVYGSRFRGSITGMALPNRIANKGLSFLASMIGPSRITDEATCYKALDLDLARSLPLRCEGFEFCPEVTGLLQKMGEPIVEVPVRYEGRDRAAGKKVRTSDAFKAVRWLFWSRYGRRAETRHLRVGGRASVSLAEVGRS